MKNSLLGVIDSNQSQNDALQRQQQQQQQELLQGSWISAYLPTWADFSLTRTQRLWGFALCLLLGVFCLLLSLMYLPSILISSRRFAFVYTMANMLLAGSTVFLVGPMQQLRNMFSSKERMIPSLVFIGSMFLTLFCAIGLHNFVIVLLCIIAQFISVMYYILSLLPFGQQVISLFISALKRMF